MLKQWLDEASLCLGCIPHRASPTERPSLGSCPSAGKHSVPLIEWWEGGTAVEHHCPREVAWREPYPGHSLGGQNI